RAVSAAVELKRVFHAEPIRVRPPHSLQPAARISRRTIMRALPRPSSARRGSLLVRPEPLLFRPLEKSHLGRAPQGALRDHTYAKLETATSGIFTPGANR